MVRHAAGTTALRRADTEEICLLLDVEWWEDPMNADPELLRDYKGSEKRGLDSGAKGSAEALAAVHALVGIDAVVRVVKVVGFVASAKDFDGQPGVINGASELLGEVFGAAGEHARSAVGVAALPLGAPVEVEVTVRVRS